MHESYKINSYVFIVVVLSPFLSFPVPSLPDFKPQPQSTRSLQVSSLNPDWLKFQAPLPKALPSSHHCRAQKQWVGVGVPLQPDKSIGKYSRPLHWPPHPVLAPTLLLTQASVHKHTAFILPSCRFSLSYPNSTHSSDPVSSHFLPTSFCEGSRLIDRVQIFNFCFALSMSYNLVSYASFLNT